MDMVPFFRLLQSAVHNRIPEQLVIQFTDQCNAACPQCGMRFSNRFKRSRLSLDQVKRILDAAAARGVQVVSFTGGEPLLFVDQLVEMIDYADKAGIRFIRTGTNGYIFARYEKNHFKNRINNLAEKLAETALRNFWISIDSSDPDLHEQMRGLPGVIKGIERGLPIFHNHGIYPSVNLGINRNIGGLPYRTAFSNDEENLQQMNPKNQDMVFSALMKSAFRRFYRFVINMGFTMVNCCYPMSVEPGESSNDLNAVYAATSEDMIVRFTAHEKALIFKALLETIPDFRSKIRIFSPRTSLYALFRQYSEADFRPYPCRGGIDFFFIDAKDGNTYPCGYRGTENLGSYADLQKRNGRPENRDCYLCDWECFRDPSELFGPILQGIYQPLDLMKKFNKDPEYLRIWFDDIRYYAACHFFDGRRPPDSKKLEAFLIH